MNHLRELIEAIEQKTLVLMVENEKDEEYEAADARHATKQVMAIAEQCVCFDIGPTTIVEEIRFENDLFILPFPVCYFESTITDAGFGGESIIGTICIQREENIIDAFIFCRRKKIWAFWIAGRIETNKEINGVKHLTVANGTCRPIPDHDEFGHYVETVGCFLSALNCTNIGRVEHSHEPKLQKARAARGKKPLFSFWTLDLQMDKASNNKESKGGTHSAPRLHLRRGHPRQFAPGKWTWVQPCIVGNKSAGIVHKDYRLTGLPHNDQGKPRAEAGEARCSESA